jgi:hypothetical protein
MVGGSLMVTAVSIGFFLLARSLFNRYGTVVAPPERLVLLVAKWVGAAVALAAIAALAVAALDGP